MTKIERHELIFNNINQQGRLPFNAIYDLFQKEAKMTIHRDLLYLIASEKIFKVGSYYCAENSEINQNTINIIKNLEIKVKLAIATNKLIVQDQVLYLSPGTTNIILVRYIKKNCVIYTNSLNVYIAAKANKFIDANLIGGRDLRNRNIFTGSDTVLAMQKIFFDFSILSVTSISPDGWLANTNQEEALIESLGCINAKKAIVIADDSKFKKIKNYRFYNLENCDLLITNNKKVPLN